MMTVLRGVRLWLRAAGRCPWLLVIAALATLACAPGDARISVHPSAQLQIMTGWEGLIGGQVSCNHTAWALVHDKVLDLATNELGMNRIRLPLRSGYESHRDLFPALMRGEAKYLDWERATFRPENDNDDPMVADPAGFQWAFLDHTVDDLVLPLKQRLVSRGDDLWINLTYIGAKHAELHRDNPAEYAELVVATFEHLRQKYGIVPNSFEVVSEPNLGNWSAEETAKNLLAAKQRLAAAGFRPDFVGPSVSSIDGSLDYFERMAAVPHAVEALDEFAYHRYSGGILALRRIGAMARARRLRTAMLEDLRAGPDELHEDLVEANVSAWQKFGMVTCPQPDSVSDGVYVLVDQSDSTHPVARLAPTARYLRQYFRHVALGAHRVEATSSNRRQKVTAFVNRGGGTTVVVRSERDGTLRVSGLPAGRYAVTATTDQLDAAALGDTTIDVGGILLARMPGRGVLTIFSR